MKRDLAQILLPFVKKQQQRQRQQQQEDAVDGGGRSTRRGDGCTSSVIHADHVLALSAALSTSLDTTAASSSELALVDCVARAAIVLMEKHDEEEEDKGKEELGGEDSLQQQELKHELIARKEFRFSQSICNVATFNPPQTKEIRKLFINSLLGVRKQLMLQTHPKCIQPGFVVTSKMLALFDVDSLLPSSLTVLSAAVSSRSRKIVLPTSRQEATKAFFDDIYATLLLVSRLCSESVEEVEEEGGDREPDISSHLPPPVEQENLPPVVLQSAEKQMRHESRVEKQQQQQHNIISQLTSSSSNFNMVVVDPLIKHQTSTVIASREEENEEEQVNQRLPQQESPDLISSSSLQQQFNDDDHIIVARPKPFKKHDLTSSSSSKPPASAPAAKSAATSSKKSHALLKKQQSQEQQQQIKTTDYEFTSITHQDQFCPACCRMCACEPLTEKDWIFKLRSRMPRETIEAIVRQLTAREEEEGEIEEEKDAEEIQMVEEDMVKEQQMDDQDEIMQVFDDGDVNDQVEELVEEVSSPSPPPLSKRKSSVQPRENNGDEEVLAKKKKNKTNSNVIITKNVIKRGNKNMLLVREPKWLDADCLASILAKNPDVLRIGKRGDVKVRWQKLLNLVDEEKRLCHYSKEEIEELARWGKGLKEREKGEMFQMFLHF